MTKFGFCDYKLCIIWKGDLCLTFINYTPLLNEQSVRLRVSWYKSLTQRCCWGQPFCCPTLLQEEAALLAQPHVHKVVRLFPVFCKHGVTTITAIPSEDETIEIYRACKVEVTISATLSQHLHRVTKNIYELLQFSFQLTHLNRIEDATKSDCQYQRRGFLFVSLLCGIMFIYENESSKT